MISIYECISLKLDLVLKVASGKQVWYYVTINILH